GVRGATSPVSRRLCLIRRTQAGLTANASAASAVPMPSSHAANTRARKSIEYAFIAGPPWQGRQRTKTTDPRYTNSKSALVGPAEEADARPPDLQRLDRSGLAVDHLAPRRHDQRVRHRPRPLLVQRLRELVAVLGPDQVVRRGDFLVLERLQRSVLLLGVIQAERDELEVPAAVHAVHRDELRQLRHARRAPGRPDVDHQELLGIVLGQLGDAGVVDLVELDRLLVPLRERPLRVLALFGPLR